MGIQKRIRGIIRGKILTSFNDDLNLTRGSICKPNLHFLFFNMCLGGGLNLLNGNTITITQEWTITPSKDQLKYIFKDTFLSFTKPENFSCLLSKFVVTQDFLLHNVVLSNESLRKSIEVQNDHPWNDIRKTITEISVSGYIDKVENDTFSYIYSNLQKVTLPKNTRLVGEAAFRSCDNLKKVYFTNDKSGGDVYECNKLIANVNAKGKGFVISEFIIPECFPSC